MAGLVSARVREVLDNCRAARELERRQGRQDWRRAPRPMSIKADTTPTTPQPA